MPTGWTGSNRRAELPPDWQRLRSRILQRDGYRCTWTDHGLRCPTPATDVDHIDDPHDHSDDNLRSLCNPHHLRRTAAQANAARWGQRKRTPTPHPGLRGVGDDPRGRRRDAGRHSA